MGEEASTIALDPPSSGESKMPPKKELDSIPDPASGESMGPEASGSGLEGKGSQLKRSIDQRSGLERGEGRGKKR